MLRTFFEMFAVTESQLSPSAIRRIRIGSLISFFVVPLFGYIHFARPDIKTLGGALIFACAIVSITGFFVMGFSRSLNRLWTPDRFLDESEIARKRIVNSFAFFWIMTTAILVLFLILILDGVGMATPEMLTDPRVVVLMLGTVIFPAMSLQGLKLAQELMPLEAEAYSVEDVKKDKVYLAMVAIYMVCVLGSAFIL